MGIFNRTTQKAMISEQPKKAAAAGAMMPATNNSGAGMVGVYYSYFEGNQRQIAMSQPTISRARDLHCTTISCMNLRMYNEVWNSIEEKMQKVFIAPRAWLRKIDPAVPNSFTLAWLVDDLFIYGRSFLYITSRTADGYPASFTRLPANLVQTLDQPGPIFYAPSKQITFQGGELDAENVVQFLSPIQGIVYMSEKAISTAIKLENARYRNASSAIPAGVLQVQPNSEPLSSQELADLAASFNAARATNQTAALSPEVHYIETATSPDKMLLIAASEYQSADLCRLTNIPPYLAGISVGSYSYQNSKESRADLWSFGTRAYADCIASTLSQDAYLPRGTFIEFNTEEYLESDYEPANEMPNTQRNDEIGSRT
jgi:hypothetical protein